MKKSMKDIIVCGIDPGVSHTTIMIYNYKESSIKTHIIESKEKGIKRLREMKLKLRKVMKRYKTRLSHIFIEGFSFGSRGSMVYTIGEWGGVMALTLYEMGFRVYRIPPTFWKKFITGKGNANKTETVVSIMNNYGFNFDNEHEYDACGIAITGACCCFKFGLSNQNKDKLAKEFKNKVECYGCKRKI